MEARAWLRRLGLLAVVLVIVQGALGGLRVTATATVLAVLHGVLGQIFLALLVAICVFATKTWASPPRRPRLVSAPTERTVTLLFVVGLIVQLGPGAILRHLAEALYIHITTVALVIVIGLLAGSHAWGLPHAQPLRKRLGVGVLVLLSVQLLPGLVALFVTGHLGTAPASPGVEVPFTGAARSPSGGSEPGRPTVLVAIRPGVDLQASDRPPVRAVAASGEPLHPEAGKVRGDACCRAECAGARQGTRFVVGLPTSGRFRLDRAPRRRSPCGPLQRAPVSPSAEFGRDP